MAFHKAPRLMLHGAEPLPSPKRDSASANPQKINIFTAYQGDGAGSVGLAGVCQWLDDHPEYITILGGSALSGGARTLLMFARMEDGERKKGNAVAGWRATGALSDQFGVHGVYGDFCRNLMNCVTNPFAFMHSTFCSLAEALCRAPEIARTHSQAFGHVVKKARHPFDAADKLGDFMVSKLAEIDARFIPFGKKTAFPVYITCSDVATHHEVCVTGDAITPEALLASCAVPNVFPAVRVNDRLCEDAAFTCENPPVQTPLNHFLAHNGNRRDFDIVVVRTNTAAQGCPAIPAGFEGKMHFLDIPRAPLQNSLLLSSGDVEAGIAAGYKAADKFFTRLLAQKAGLPPPAAGPTRKPRVTPAAVGTLAA